jgi:ATP-dependent DNA helicase RecG
MPPKVKSTTTSSTSATSEPARCRPAKAAASATPTDIETPVQFVKGVGPRLGAVFQSREIRTVRDLLTFFPRAYEDRTKLLKVAELVDGENATVAVQVNGARRIPTRNGRMMLEARCADTSGTLMLKWFYAPKGLEQRLQTGTQIIVTGQAKRFMSRMEIVHPEITWNLSSDAAASNVGRVVPIYTEIEGIPSRTFRKILWEALEKYSPYFVEDLPPVLLAKHRLPPLREAVRTIHFPEGAPAEAGDAAAGGSTAGRSAGQKPVDLGALVDFNTPAHWRMVYEEFFKFEYLVLKQRLRMEKLRAPVIGQDGGRAAMDDLERSLPFRLTGDQRKSLGEILDDLGTGHPMNRLIQGDVGSGKTAVAFLSAGAAIAEGGQVVLMAPTEILAEQHYKNSVKLLSGKVRTALLTGKTPQSERNQLHARLEAGEPLMLIGTHALIEDVVRFKNLVYVMIDEQHRFGVEQRRALKMKGVRQEGEGKVFPHTLILTATPIPRTLALTAYGDLAVSSIKEMPPGRTPIQTQVIRGDARMKAFERIRGELASGRQAYFIYPLVNESEAEGFTSLKSAVFEAERLQHEVFPEFKVGLLHGQMRPDEKAQVMDRFSRNELQILVSTTVVEVGVDVPNATVMVIEHAERFGLSQLHQLRGRVGRGSHQSYCYLFAAKQTGETTDARLDVLEKTTDGFKIAEADLEIRGPGEFLGTRQAGGLPFRLAHLVRDREWLLRARDDVQALLEYDPELEAPEHLPLRRYYEREGKLQFERLKTS